MKNWLSKLLMFFLGFVLGAVGIVGGIIGFGYWGYKNVSVNKFEEMSKQDLSFLDAFMKEDAELKGMTIEEIILSFSSIPDKTFEQLAVEFGLEYPAQISFLTDALSGIKIKELGGSVGSVIENIKIGEILGSPYNDFNNYPEDYEGAVPEGATSLLWVLRNHTLNTASTNLMDEVKIGSLLGSPYDDLSNTASAIPEGATSMLWAIKGYTINNMSDNLLKEVKIGSILGEPYSNFETYPADYVGALPEGAEAMLWDLRNYTIQGETNGIGKYPDTLTVADLKNVFGVTLPELLDVDDAVLIKDLGDEINNLYIYDIIDAPQESADQITKNIINKIRYLKTDGTTAVPTGEEVPVEEGQPDWYKLSGINALMNQLPSSLTIQDVLTDPSQDASISGMSKVIMQKIFDGNSVITQLSTSLPNTLESIFIHEIVDAPSAGADHVTTSLITKIRSLTHDDGTGTQVAYTLGEFNRLLNDLPAALTIKDVLEQPQGSGMAVNILTKVWATNASLNNLSTELTAVFNELTFYDILEVPVNADNVTGRIINKLRTEKAPDEYWKVTEIEAAMDTFTFGDLYPSSPTGILSLIDPTTSLDGVPAEMENVITQTTMQNLFDKGLISTQPHATIAGFTLEEMIIYFNNYLGA